MTRRSNKTPELIISLEPAAGLQKLSCSDHEAHIDVVGAGDANYKFPTSTTFIERGLKNSPFMTEPKTVVGKVVKKVRDRRRSRKAGAAGRNTVVDTGAKQMLPTGTPIRIIPRLPDEPSDALGKTLIKGATGLQGNMVSRQLDGLVYENFGTDIGTLHWVLNGGVMPKRYHSGADSLAKQFEVLTPRFKEAIIGLLKELHKRNPEVPQSTLLKHAVELLNEQLAGFRFISKVYCDSFAQYRDGVYSKELMAINFFYEQAAALFKRVDPDSPGKKPEGLESIMYQVGDVYLARFTTMSLATIPGSKGPIGIHALQMPFDFQDILAIMLPLLAHEFRHNLFADVKGLEDEMRSVLRSAIIEDHKSGKLKFGSETMMLGSQQVSTRDLMIKLMVDSIGEIDADIAGGVLFSGTSYLYNMMLSFPAMLVRGTPLSQAKKLLRTESSYRLVPQDDGSHALVFEPHPPDYIRAYIVAAGLEEIGFKAEADECRRLADFAVGTPLPTHITWVDGGGEHEEGEGEEGGAESKKQDMVIAFTVEDIKAVAPTVARAIIRAKLKSLGGRSTLDMVDWNAAREAKVQKLADVLVAGKSEVPSDIGSVYATYVGAAATLAYWRLLHNSGADVDASEVAKAVTANAMKMIASLLEKAPKAE